MDGSDEAECRNIVFPVGYNKFLTPSPDSRENLNIDITVTILDILKIDEVEGDFVIQLATKREWFDNRLTYEDLKNDRYLDKLSNKEQNSIWSPYLIFDNMADHDKKQCWNKDCQDVTDKRSAKHDINRYPILPFKNL